MNDKIFRHSIRVPYAHVDKMGVVYYANYFVYFEMARSEMLRNAGMPYGELEESGIFLPVVEAHCEYKAPARFDDLLTLLTRCSPSGRVGIRIGYELMRDSALLALGHTIHVCLSPQGRVVRMPQVLTSLYGGSPPGAANES